MNLVVPVLLAAIGLSDPKASEISDFQVCRHCVTNDDLIKFVESDPGSRSMPGSWTVLLASLETITVYVVRFETSSTESSGHVDVKVSSIDRADEDTQVQFATLVKLMKRPQFELPENWIPSKKLQSPLPPAIRR